MEALLRSQAPRELVRQLHLDREVARVSKKRTPEQRAQDVVGDDDVNRQEGVGRPEFSDCRFDPGDERGLHGPHGGFNLDHSL